MPMGQAEQRRIERACRRLIAPVVAFVLVLSLAALVPRSAWADAPAVDPATSPAADLAKTELQTQIESGSDLTSRGKKVLFRARTHQDAERYDKAVEILDEWLIEHPDREHPLLRFQLGLAYLGLQNKEAAVRALQKAVTQEPRFARAWLRMGEAAYELEEFETAADAFDRGYELNPVARPEFLYYSCIASLMGGQSERALADLERLLSLHRDVATLEWYRAVVAAASAAEEPRRAADPIQNALADNGDDPDAWELAYRYAAGLQDYEAAVVYLTITDYLQPLNRQQWRQLGDLYAGINVPLMAARCYETALDRAAVGAEPGAVTEGTSRSRAQAQEYERLAGAWLAAHRHDEARETLRRALAQAESRRLWSLLGDLNYMTEDYAGALEAFGRGCELDPNFGRGWLMMGYCARELDRSDEARTYLERAAEFPEQAAGAAVLLAE
jgi:tetratricopeptide (TPR) repeat protein